MSSGTPPKTLYKKGQRVQLAATQTLEAPVSRLGVEFRDFLLQPSLLGLQALLQALELVLS